MIKYFNLNTLNIFLSMLIFSFLFTCEFIENITKSADNDKCGSNRTAENSYESPASGLPLHLPFTTYLEDDIRHFLFYTES